MPGPYKGGRRGGIYPSRGVGGGGKVHGRHECLPYKPSVYPHPTIYGKFCREGLDPSGALDSGAKLHGAVKTAPYKAVFYSILSKSGIKISMF